MLAEAVAIRAAAIVRIVELDRVVFPATQRQISRSRAAPRPALRIGSRGTGTLLAAAHQACARNGQGFARADRTLRAQGVFPHAGACRVDLSQVTSVITRAATHCVRAPRRAGVTRRARCRLRWRSSSAVAAQHHRKPRRSRSEAPASPNRPGHYSVARFRCPKHPDTTIDFESCSERRVLALNARVNRVTETIWRRLRSAVGRRYFAKGERAWEAYVRNECAARSASWVDPRSPHSYAGGTLAPVLGGRCEAELTASRLSELTKTAALLGGLDGTIGGTPPNVLDYLQCRHTDEPCGDENVYRRPPSPAYHQSEDSDGEYR